MSFFSMLDGKALPELVALFMSDPAAHGIETNDLEVFLQETAAAIAQQGAEGVAFLLKALPGVDAQRRQAIVVAFSVVNKHVVSPYLSPIKAALVSFLSVADADLIAKSVDGINHLGFLDLADAVAALLHHESPYVVGSALRFYGRNLPAKATPILINALSSPEPIVRQNAIDELDELDCKGALPSIAQLLDDPDKDVREAARWATKHLGSADGDKQGMGGPVSPVSPLPNNTIA